MSTEKREAIIKGIKEQQQARFKKIEMAKNIREEIQQNRSKDLEEKAQQKFLTAKELLENQEKARQVKVDKSFRIAEINQATCMPGTN